MNSFDLAMQDALIYGVGVVRLTMESLGPEFERILHENFWDMLDDDVVYWGA